MPPLRAAPQLFFDLYVAYARRDIEPGWFWFAVSSLQVPINFIAAYIYLRPFLRQGVSLKLSPVLRELVGRTACGLVLYLGSWIAFYAYILTLPATNPCSSPEKYCLELKVFVVALFMCRILCVCVSHRDDVPPRESLKALIESGGTGWCSSSSSSSRGCDGCEGESGSIEAAWKQKQNAVDATPEPNPELSSIYGDSGDRPQRPSEAGGDGGGGAVRRLNASVGEAVSEALRWSVEIAAGSAAAALADEEDKATARGQAQHRPGAGGGPGDR